MAIIRPIPNGRERFFDPDEVIVSKTDKSGRITYANDVFLRVAGYTEEEILGQPHSCIRHPDMPRCIFKLLWDTIQGGTEIFAYVVNLSATGEHYWVLAHVTPTLDPTGNIVGYHSNRRVPERRAIDTVRTLYQQLLREEQRFSDKHRAISASMNVVKQLLSEKEMTYDQFFWSL